MIKRTNKNWHSRLEQLEARQMLAATVAIEPVLPQFRNEALDRVEIEFSEAVSGFDVGDLILTLDGAAGVQRIDLAGVAQLTDVGNRSFTLSNIASLTGDDGDYQFTLDVVNSGIKDAQGQPLAFEGTGLGPELIANSSFDTAGGGSNNLAGWLFPNGGVIWQQESPGDGVARVISSHPGTLLDPNMPEGAASAKIRQGFNTAPLTTYQLEFDLFTQRVVEEVSRTDIKLQVLKGNPASGLLFSETYDRNDNGHLLLEFETEADDQGITVQFIASRTARDFTVDNVSVRRLVRGPSVEWTMDATPPVAAILSVDPDPRNVPLSSVTIAFDDDATGLRTSDFVLTRDRGQGPETLSLAGTSISAIDGQTYLLQGLASLTEVHATYVLRFDASESQVRDLAGNPIVRDAAQSWVVDRIAPVITVVTQTTEEVSPEFNGTVDDPLAVVSVQLVGNNFPSTQFTAINRGNGLWTLPAGAISPALSLDGTYHVRVTATDVAGNVAVDGTLNELTLDRIPVVTVDPLVTQDHRPPLTGTIDDPTATVEIRVDGVTYSAINNGDGTWLLPNNTIRTPLAETLFDVQATATDSGGKVGTDNTLRELTIGPAVIISEFMADNNNTLVDFEGDPSDWIELLNIGASLPASGLLGWYLTDEPNNLTKWEVPVVTPLGTNRQVLIYASGKDLVAPNGELHTNFQLGSGGEYLALVKPDGVTIAAEFDNPPNQREDVSYGIINRNVRWFTTPTPGTPNNAGVVDFVGDTAFSIDRGFYDEPIQVEISTDTNGAEIRYTLDGTWPGEGVGRRYTGPITIDSTTTLRAVALKPNFFPSNVDTQTYLFLDDVIDQSTAPRVGPSDDRVSFPSSWGGTSADYQMDPDVTGNPLYADQMRDALVAIPTLSLTLAQADIFGSGGLFSNPGGSAERRTSAEMFFPDGTSGFQIDAGLRIQGGASRNTPYKKHSLSLRFRDIYGDGRLDYPLFKDSPVDSFDSLHLRAMYNNSWIHWDQGQRNRGSMIRDQWMRDALLAMGQVDAGQGTYVHLYLNGLYWGVYNLHERPRAAHYADYNGGADAVEDDYDALNSGEAEDGNTSSWNSLITLVRTSA